MKITIEDENVQTVDQIVNIKKKLNDVFKTDFSVALKGKSNGDIILVFEDN